MPPFALRRPPRSCLPWQVRSPPSTRHGIRQQVHCRGPALERAPITDAALIVRLAGALSRIVVSRILDRGEEAFLHAYAGHAATVAFYEGLGFSIRTRMTYTVLA